MKLATLVWTICIAIGLLANNLVLLYMMDYFDEPAIIAVSNETSTLAPQSPSLPAIQAKTTQPALQPTLQPTRELESSANNDVASKVTELPEGELSEKFKDFVKTDEFQKAIDQYRIDLQRRQNAQSQKMSQMTAEELLLDGLDLESNTSNLAMVTLLQDGKFTALDSSQLKLIWNEGRLTQSWSKSSVLQELVNRNDGEALEWAKNAISNQEISEQYSGELYGKIYQYDSAFVDQRLSALDFSNNETFTVLSSVFTDAPEAVSTAITNNIDSILDSRSVSYQQYTYLLSDTEIKLTQAQKFKVTNLFDSQRQQDRQKGISLIASLDDVDTIRTAYSKLSKRNEKLQAIGYLYKKTDDPDYEGLIVELSEEFGNTFNGFGN